MAVAHPVIWHSILRPSTLEFQQPFHSATAQHFSVLPGRAAPAEALAAPARSATARTSEGPADVLRRLRRPLRRHAGPQRSTSEGSSDVLRCGAACRRSGRLSRRSTSEGPSEVLRFGAACRRSGRISRRRIRRRFLLVAGAAGAAVGAALLKGHQKCCLRGQDPQSLTRRPQRCEEAWRLPTAAAAQYQ